MVTPDPVATSTKNENNWDKIIGAITAGLTLIVLGFTLAVLIRQCRYTEERDVIVDRQNSTIESLRTVQAESLKAFSKRQADATESIARESRRSVEAAQRGVMLAGKSFANSDRPIIYITPRPGWSFNGGEKPVFRFIVKNYGRTPALNIINKRYLREAISEDQVTLNVERVFKKVVFEGMREFNLPPGDSTEFDFTAEDTLSKAAYDSVVHGSWVYAIMGRITYRGYQTSGNDTLNYCWLYKPGSGIFLSKTFNYYKFSQQESVNRIK